VAAGLAGDSLADEPIERSPDGLARVVRSDLHGVIISRIRGRHPSVVDTAGDPAYQTTRPTGGLNMAGRNDSFAWNMGTDLKSVLLVFATLALVSGPLLAGDVTSPAEVSGLVLSRSGNDVDMTWTPVTQDAGGNPESVDHYVVYRSVAATFPDHYFVGSTTDSSLSDLAAADDSKSYYYLVAAVDVAGNEGLLGASVIDSPSVLSGSTGFSTIELTWTDALPGVEVASELRGALRRGVPALRERGERRAEHDLHKERRAVHRLLLQGPGAGPER
jgi:hypothetical protein